MIDHHVVLETIRPPLVASHTRTDLLSAGVVLSSLRSRPKTIIKHGNQRCHSIAVVRVPRSPLTLLLQPCRDVDDSRTVKMTVSYCPLSIPYSSLLTNPLQCGCRRRLTSCKAYSSTRSVRRVEGEGGVADRTFNTAAGGIIRVRNPSTGTP